MAGAFETLLGDMLGRVTHGDSSSDILADISRHWELREPGTIAGITVLDRSTTTFEPGIFPSLDPQFGNSLAGIKVADKPGSCALAVAEGIIVDCTDIASDQRFSEEWRHLSLQHGLGALSSFPATQRDGLALGTFVVAYDAGKPLEAKRRERALRYANLCGQILAYRRRQVGQELLIGELEHRTRNLFNTIGAVVYSTLKTNPDIESFRKVLDGRLTAMAKAHSLALNAGNADLRQLLLDTLAPYASDHEVKIEGPRMQLAQESAMAFCLAVHELATNAAKYGALSNEGGALQIAWQCSSGKDGKFEFQWIESGGPVVKPPTRHGFGQRVIRSGLSSAFDGSVELDFKPEGLQFTLTAPESARLGRLVH